ncbi:hypothetical protein [Spirosoma panaciterrae]|uniref:hypothetical protein n=1 Tax=Spirosoma panaciterrae TaxID=496058 RepID=UPI00036E983D|nr:hypothetical protein [Spirosoma panaciterrae]
MKPITTIVLLFFCVVGFSQNSYQNQYQFWFTRDNIDFYYRWRKDCNTCEDRLNLKIHNRNSVRKDIHYNFQWMSNGSVIKNDKGLNTIGAGVTKSGDIDGQFFYPPNGYSVSTLRFRYEYLYICDYNVDCWKVTGNATQTNGNTNQQNQTQYQSGSSSYNQSNAQSAYQQQLAEAERKRQALLEKQRTEQQQALDQQRQQATQQYNQQMADLQQQQAQIEQSSQQVAEAIVSLLDTEVEALTESDELGILSGGINNLMSPLITSNQTNTGGLGKTSWFFSAARLSRKGLSFSFSTGGMEQYDEKFSIKAQGTSGNYTVFSGPLTISTFSFAGSVGKDIAYSKNGRFHLFFGPGIGYMMVKHSWKYSASQPAYEESKLSKDQFYWTLDGQMIFMFSQRLGLQGGVTWGGPFSKTDEKALYKLGSFSSYSLGLAFRIL